MHSASFRMWALGPSPEIAKVVLDVWPPPWQGPSRLGLASADRHRIGYLLPTLPQSAECLSSLGLAILPPLTKKALPAKQLGGPATPQIGPEASPPVQLYPSPVST